MRSMDVEIASHHGQVGQSVLSEISHANLVGELRAGESNRGSESPVTCTRHERKTAVACSGNREVQGAVPVEILDHDAPGPTPY